jgi:hypothetical protein
VASFERGERIEAQFKGGSKWFSGVISAVNRNGTYDIKYSDGDTEFDVSASKIRSLDDERPSSPSRDSRPAKLYEGDDVEARFKGGSKWYKGRITGVNRDGSYDIRYADGDSERDVPSDFVRPVGGGSDRDLDRDLSQSRDIDRTERPSSPSRDSKPNKLHIGDEVEARYRGSAKWFKGRITAVHRDGSYDIRYADGDSERGVLEHLVRKYAPDEFLSATFYVGDQVEAVSWLPGRISHVGRGELYDVSLSNGRTLQDTPGSDIRSASVRGSSRDLGRDDRVEVLLLPPHFLFVSPPPPFFLF